MTIYCPIENQKVQKNWNAESAIRNKEQKPSDCCITITLSHPYSGLTLLVYLVDRHQNGSFLTVTTGKKFTNL